jgi:hypothetical protein|nr:MAG TPA: hypothetical protein [Caudoviricetes sp.]
MRVVGTVRSERLNKDIPLYDIPMMTDEKWKEMTNTTEQRMRRESLRKYGDPFRMEH